MSTTKTYPHLDRFYALLERHFAEVKGRDPLKLFREKAYDHFLELGLPEKKEEAFRYFPLRQLYAESFEIPLPPALIKGELFPFILPEAEESHLVFVDGYFMPHLSSFSALPKQVVVLPLLDAMRSYGNFLQNRWSKTLREENDPFAILNLALYPQGAFIYVPPKTVFLKPLQCLFLTTTPEYLAVPRLQLFVASQAEVKWISTYKGPGLCNSVIDLALEDTARFEMTEAVHEHPGWLLSSLRASLKRGAYFSCQTAVMQAEKVRQSTHLSLQGEGAQASLKGLSLLQDKEQSHTHVVVQHEAPSCTSIQKFKTALTGFSQSSFEGKIYVQPVAQKTEAYQLNNNLLLSDYAVAHSKPNLEIFADDVKASHGATVSQLDEEALFYLRTRGISSEQAKKLLLESFIKEQIEEIPYPSLRTILNDYVNTFC